MLTSSKSFFFFLKETYESNRTIIIVSLVLSFLQVVTASVGIVLILPLIELLDNAAEPEQLHWITQNVLWVFNTLNIPVDTLNILIVFSALVGVAFFIRFLHSRVVAKLQNDVVTQEREALYSLAKNSYWIALHNLLPSKLTHALVYIVNASGRAITLTNSFLNLTLLIVFGIAASSMLSLELMGVIILFVLVSGAAILPIYKRSKDMGKSQLHAMEALHGTFSEHFANSRLLKSEKFDGYFERQASHEVEELKDKSLRLQHQTALTQLLLGLVVIISLVAFTYISLDVLSISFAETVVAIIILARLLPLVSGIQQSGQQLMHLLPQIAELNNIKMYLRKNLEVKHNDTEEWHVEKGVSVQHVGLQSFSGAWLCRNVNFNIQPYGVNLLFGVSGTGKSSCADALAGLREVNEGKISIGSTVLSSNNIHHWRSHVHYLSQEVNLLSTSLRNNLCLGHQFSDSQLLEALASVGLSSWMTRYNVSLDSSISALGRNVSGGQAQRIQMARALLQQPKLLILDEVTAHLDKQSARDIASLVAEISKNMTVLVISHDTLWHDYANHQHELISESESNSND
ncbi:MULTISPECIES: ABC transporter ATP-binding protein [Gammaproteobacteria]|uniref:ATP-binding cassette domain-containing protein n=1 Tax=Gammaproteobacteria TaxID=1236 RepID=UPI000DD0E794|nr:MULTISPECIES: ABC transporter ATP-binding protein [Gammaproteobacteria]RTE86089.1 ABC transporter ATP-binding protein [Aliidiomarina sp. B3213]TCZ91443.1 ABC transporter ATP-binding protein [Lysobacter sp. N42]